MSAGWDNTTLKKLKALTGKGLSTAEIGKRLGMSKNAIVGKLNRLGWNSKAGGVAEPKVTAKTPAKATTTKPAAKSKVAPSVPVKVPAKVAPKVAPTPAPKSKPTSAKDSAMHQRIVQHSLAMANLKPNQCHWPMGDPDSDQFHFCGDPVFVGKPYCYNHCKQAYQFNPPKKK